MNMNIYVLYEMKYKNNVTEERIIGTYITYKKMEYVVNELVNKYKVDGYIEDASNDLKIDNTIILYKEAENNFNDMIELVYVIAKLE